MTTTAMASEPKRLLKPTEVAELLSCSRTKVYDLFAAGDIPTVRVGAAIRVHPDDFAAYIERSRRG